MRSGAVSISRSVMNVVSAKVEFRTSTIEVSKSLGKVRTLVLIVSGQIEKKSHSSSETVALLLTVSAVNAYSGSDAQTKTGVLEERIPRTAFRCVGCILAG